MNWQDNVRRWRELPAERKLQLRWESIAEDVANSMAFEKEPVEIDFLREILARIGPPDTLKPLREF